MQTRRRRSVEDQTGKSLDEWFALLDSVDGKHKSHHELWRWRPALARLLEVRPHRLAPSRGSPLRRCA
jgi:hypothetical protein